MELGGPVFDHRHYVPILRWKRAEWVALRHLKPEDRARITPLVEITPRSVTPGTRRPTIGQMLQKMRIPGQGDRDSEVIPVSIPKLIRSRFRDEAGRGFRF